MRWWTLHRLTRSKDPQARRRALARLVEAEDPCLGEILPGAVEDPNGAIRRDAVLALAVSKEYTNGPVAARLLNDPEPGVREAAAEAVHRLGYQDATIKLVGLLKDPDSNVRWRAAATLEAFGWRGSSDEENALHLAALGRLEAAAGFGSAAIEPLISVLKSGVYYKRLQAIEALSRIADPKVVKPLIAALSDEDNHVRASAIEALSIMGDARATDPLVRVLKDPDSRVRTVAVEALSKLGDSRAAEALAKLVKDTDWEVRKAVIDALGKAGNPKVIPSLVSCLHDSDRDIRLSVVSALGRIRDEKAIEFLAVALADEHEPIRQAAVTALGSIHASWTESAGAKRAIPRLQTLAKNKNYWVRQCAVETLILLGAGETTEMEPDDLTARIDPVQTKRNAALEALQDALKDEDRDFRQAAAEALGRVGDTRAIDGLEGAMKDPDPWVRKAGARSLKTLQWEPESPGQEVTQCILIDDWDRLVQMGSEAVPALARMAASKVTAQRQIAVDVLSRIPDPAAVPILERSLADEAPHVRAAAAAALEDRDWKPNDPLLAAAQAVALQRWDQAIGFGVHAVDRLVGAALDRQQDPETRAAAESALTCIQDPLAIDRLIANLERSDLALALLSAVQQILAAQADSLAEPSLARLAELPPPTQTEYETDPESGVSVPMPARPIDVGPVRELARAELNRRKAGGRKSSEAVGAGAPCPNQ